MRIHSFIKERMRMMKPFAIIATTAICVGCLFLVTAYEYRNIDKVFVFLYWFNASMVITLTTSLIYLACSTLYYNYKLNKLSNKQ